MKLTNRHLNLLAFAICLSCDSASSGKSVFLGGQHKETHSLAEARDAIVGTWTGNITEIGFAPGGTNHLVYLHTPIKFVISADGRAAWYEVLNGGPAAWSSERHDGQWYPMLGTTAKGDTIVGFVLPAKDPIDQTSNGFVMYSDTLLVGEERGYLTKGDNPPTRFTMDTVTYTDINQWLSGRCVRWTDSACVTFHVGAQQPGTSGATQRSSGDTACSRARAETALLAVGTARTNPAAKLGRGTSWTEAGPCSWLVEGILGWRDELSNEPQMFKFNAAVARNDSGTYSVDSFVLSGGFP